jgi:prepilin-type N-terminal cleavage/methylation domain-containing protein
VTSRAGDVAGFTLVELLVVLAIMCLLAGALPLAREALNATKPSLFADQILVDCLRLRAFWISSGRVAALRHVPGSTTYELMPSNDRRVVPGTLSLEINTASTEQDQPVPEALHFFPDGSSDGGVIAVRSGGGALAQVVVSGVTGVAQIPSE